MTVFLTRGGRAIDAQPLTIFHSPAVRCTLMRSVLRRRLNEPLSGEAVDAEG